MAQQGAAARYLRLREPAGVKGLKCYVHDNCSDSTKIKWELRRLLDELRGGPVRTWEAPCCAIPSPALVPSSQDASP